MKLIVHGRAVPQGSKNAYVRNGRAVLVDAKGVSLKEWRQAVAAEARLFLRKTDTPPIDGPVRMEVTFYLSRPKSAPKRVLYPATKPDCDKLLRGIFDALEGVAYVNDSRVVEVIARKRFAIESAPRAEILVEEMP